MNINKIVRSLAEYMRIAEETTAIIDDLKDQLKAAMQAAGTDTIIGAEHKATYKTVTSSRIDTAALKKGRPDIADAFNKCDSILKALYQLKENGLRAGKTDESKTACTGVDNRNICGYGSGYSVLPYFEGGVGASCFWSILKDCGYKTREHHTKHSDFYSVEKEG